MIRSVIVQLDRDAQVARRTRFAAQLSRQLGAHLTGLASTGLLVLPGTVPVQAAAGELAQLLWDDLRRETEEAAQAFVSTCSDLGLTDYDAVVDEDDKTGSLLSAARCSDLVVVSQADPEAGNYAEARALVERVVLECARPVLVLPYVGEFSGHARQVLVAWDDSREAARALSDALPLIRGADRVRVLTWIDPSEDETRYYEKRLASVAAWLARHGVKAEVMVDVADRISVGDAALSRAADFGADLLVMGAYGHARWTERLLGGATRGILRSMTVPVLMSH